MWMANYSKFGWLAFALAGAGASQFGTVWSYILYGWSSMTDYLIAIPINLISGFFFSGLLGYWLGKLIEKHGTAAGNPAESQKIDPEHPDLL